MRLNPLLLAAVFALASFAYGNSYLSFRQGDFPLGNDFVFNSGTTVEIFIDFVPSDPLFTGFVTINGGTLRISPLQGSEAPSFDDSSIFQLFTPGQFSGEFDEIIIFDQTGYQMSASSTVISGIDSSLDFSFIGSSNHLSMSYEDFIAKYGPLAEGASFIDKDGKIHFAQMPEPSTCALIFAGAIAGLALLRRKKR